MVDVSTIVSTIDIGTRLVSTVILSSQEEIMVDSAFSIRNRVSMIIS